MDMEITNPKPPIVYTESRTIPRAIVRYVWIRDGGECVSPGCRSKTELELDHCPPWALLRPKRHDPDKIFLRCAEHHGEKSKTDTREIARAKRLEKKQAGEWREPKVKIKSRGFRQDGPKRKIPSRPFRRIDQ